jgi:hypothetical protein
MKARKVGRGAHEAYQVEHYLSLLRMDDAPQSTKAAVLRETREAMVGVLEKLGTFGPDGVNGRRVVYDDDGRVDFEVSGITADDLRDDERAQAAAMKLTRRDAPRVQQRAAYVIQLCLQGEVHGMTPKLAALLSASLLGLQLEMATQQQSERRAKREGALTPAQRQRMLQQYAARVSAGQKYGAVKALAAAFNVSERTVRNVVSGNSIRQQPG